jgi:hypothetical protein
MDMRENEQPDDDHAVDRRYSVVGAGFSAVAKMAKKVCGKTRRHSMATTVAMVPGSRRKSFAVSRCPVRTYARTHARTHAHAHATRMGASKTHIYKRTHAQCVGMMVAHRRVSESACLRPRARTRAHTHVCKRAYIEYVVCWGGGCVGGIALTCVPASLPHAQLGMKMPTHGVNLKDKENNVHSATPARSASALPCIPSVTH